MARRNDEREEPRLPRSIVEQKETEAAEELGAECVGISVFEEE